MKALVSKKPPKDQREKQVLLGLVDLFLETGKPVGSHTLQENGFDKLSSATIRNYFAKLEKDGYLRQQHSSGGRVPTHLAYELYAETYQSAPILEEKDRTFIEKKLSKETHELANYLQQVVESLVDVTNCAVFLSAPRFEQDFILEVKLVAVDNTRCLAVLITNFGFIQTETLYSEKKVSSFTLKRIEAFFRWKLNNLEKPVLTESEEALATRFYGEVMLRHLVGNAEGTVVDIYKTGFFKLLNYSDFNDATALAHGLSLFENKEILNKLLNACSSNQKLTYWIGGDLQSCSAMAIPYCINQTIVGSIAILGPNRIPYRRLFGILQCASQTLTKSLTKSMYKFKITFRHVEPSSIEEQKNLYLLLENKNDR